MTHPIIHVLLAGGLTACAVGGDDSGKGSSVAPGGLVDLALTFDGAAFATGSCIGVRELSTPAREEGGAEDCAAAVELHSGSCWGVNPIFPTFSQLEVGSASEMLDPLWMVWSESDPGAEATESTGQWRGTMEIIEWSAERRVLELVDGVRCAIDEDEDCAPTTGSLVIEGVAEDPADASADNLPPAWRDAVADEPLCSSDRP